MQTANDTPIELWVTVKDNNYQPGLRVCRDITSVDTIRIILEAIMTGRPVLVMPKFSKSFQSLALLAEKGLVFYDYNNNEWRITNFQMKENLF